MVFQMIFNDKPSMTLSRDIAHRKISGVCAGFSRYTATPVWLWEVAFVIATFFGGLGLFAYIALTLFMPVDKSREANAPHPSSAAL